MSEGDGIMMRESGVTYLSYLWFFTFTAYSIFKCAAGLIVASVLTSKCQQVFLTEF